MKKGVGTYVMLPEDLKKRLNEFCNKHGLKINYTVAVAIKKFLDEFRENEEDIILAGERMLGDFEGEEEYLKKLRERGLDV